MRRALRITVVTALALSFLLLLGVVVLTRSDFGRNRVRNFALDALRNSLNGQVEIGRLEGNLLGNFSLHDVRISDSTGRPFLAAERVTADVNTSALLSRRVELSHLTLVRPVIHLSKTPDEDWNYASIFGSGDGSDTTAGWGSWVVLRDVRLVDGKLIMQRPWAPDADITGTRRDSLIRAALAGETRTRVDRAEYGLRQTIDFSSINAYMSTVLVAHADSADMILAVDSLAMVAAPFHPPALDVRQFAGVIRVGEDTVRAGDFALHLPDTRTRGSFSYILSSADMYGTLHADTVALADIRALYPDLPKDGGGRLKMELALRDTGASEFEFTDVDLRTGGAEIGGKLALVVADSILSFRDSDITFARLPTALIEQMAPGAEVPVAGTLTGRARLNGAMERLRIDAAATFDPERHEPFRVVARGGVGFGRIVTARDLFLHAELVPVSIAREFGVDPRVGGVVNAEATLNGSTALTLRGPYRIVHNDNGIVSRIAGEASIAPKAGMRMDIGLRLEPLSLDLAERLVQGTDFRGEVTGSGRITGTPRDLALRMDLELPGAGGLLVEGTWATPNDDIPVYAATLTMRNVNLRSMVAAYPQTALNGVTRLEGRDLDPATMNARLNATLQLAVVDSAEIRNVVLTASANEGRLTLDTLAAVTSFASLSAAGTFGLVEGRQGTLRYQARITDLAGLRRWIEVGDTSRVAARPLLGARLARAREVADSIRRVEESRADPAAQLAADLSPRAPRPRVRPVAVPAIPRDSIAGAVSLEGEATGHVKRFDLTSAIETIGVIWGGNMIGSGSIDVTWKDVATPANMLAAEGGVDTLRVAGFAFDSTRFNVTYQRQQGDVKVSVFPGDTAQYDVDARYALHSDHGEVHLRDVRLRFDSTAWASTRASTVSWRGQGLTVDSLELRNRNGRGGGRIFVHGEIPDTDPGRMEFAVDSMRVAPWLTLVQSDVTADGVAMLRGVFEGTRDAPRINGNLTLTRVSYSGTAFPDIEARLDYAARQLTIDSRFRRGNGAELARISGTVPIDLSLGDSVETRLLEAPLALTIEGDSIPLAPIAEFTDAITTFQGRAYGRVTVAGTWKVPSFGGAIGLDASRVGVAATGVTVTNLVGRLRFAGDTMLIDSLGARAQGTLRGSGYIVLAELDRPVMNLTLEAERARVLADERGSLIADANLRLRGPLDTMTVTGNVLVRSGVLHIPDPERMDIIDTEDPAIFALVDTATAQQLDVAPPSKVMQNLTMDIDLDVRRGVFARSSDANVEIYGTLDLAMDPSTRGEVIVFGSLFTDRGDYSFMGKRFEVSRGSVRFTGEPDPNPVLQVLAVHEVRQAGRAPLEIRVILGGTMRQPSVSLESDAQPKMSQSDLISFLAFGKSSSSLLQFTSTGVEGGGQGGSSLVGSVGALARRQLAAIALGALVDEVKSDLTDATRADVVHITPAELPADVSLGSLQTVLRGTEIEIGKYADRHTFVSGRVRPTLAIPGASVERRIGQRFILRGTFDTRFQPRAPSLSTGLEPTTVQVFGALLTMKLAW
jgi:translocation and assembly module TamB